MKRAMGLYALGLWSFAWMASAATPAVEARFLYRYQLQLQFPEAMQQWDNATERQRVRLEPALPVACTWGSDTRLDCGFEGTAAPAPATRYRIFIDAGFRTQQGETLPAQVVEAETGRPALRAYAGRWQDAVPLVELTADVPVAEAAVRAVLRASLDGEAIPLPPLRTLPARGDWDREPRFALDLSGVTGSDRVLALSIVPGLRSTAGPLPGTQSDTLLRVLVNESAQLRGGVCGGRQQVVQGIVSHARLTLECMPGEQISLLFSRPLDDASRARFAAALPEGVRLLRWGDWPHWPVPRRGAAVPQASPGFAAMLMVDAARHAATFALPGDLSTQAPSVRLPSVQVALRTDVHRPSLRAEASRALIADGDNAPVLARAFNTAPVTLAEQSLAADWRTGKLSTPPASGTVPAAVVSPDARNALAGGGWVRWAPETKAPRHPVQDVQFAAPAFDLFAVAGRREVLVWANAWTGAASIAGAEVELLWLESATVQPRRVARARTDDDGVARLRLPDDFQVPDSDGTGDFPMWMLRAEHGSGRSARRAVLPAWQPSRYSASLGRAAEIRTWGVADKPLYRAGESVRFRLWQRAVEGNRLLAVAAPQARELRLVSQQESRTVRRWQAAPLPDGSFAGDAELPVHLTDGGYCIGVGEDDEDAEGTCFYAGTYRAQDLWVEAKTADRALRDGETFAVDVEAGYYSGGPAAGIALSRVTTWLAPLPLQQAWPEYADYSFIDVFTPQLRSGLALAGESELRPTTDPDGRVRIALPVAFDAGVAPEHLPAYGQLQLVAEARLSDREATASNAAKARYAWFERYAGLRLLEPRWLDASTPVRVQGVVIDADGRLVADAAMVLEVDYLPGPDTGDAESAERLARCDLPVGEVADCDFPRTRSGRYRLTARSGDAAPASVTHYVWVHGGESRPGVRTGLELLQPPASDGAPVRLLLRQRHARSRVLFVVGAGESILAHRVVAVTGETAPVDLPIGQGAGWRGKLRVSAYVLAPTDPRVEGGYREPSGVERQQVELDLPERKAMEPPIALEFPSTAAAPGETRTLRVRNASATTRELAIAVVDDALRALAQDVLPYFDPWGDHWLGRESGGAFGLRWTSFAQWRAPAAWQLPLRWPRGASAATPPVPEDCSGHDGPAAAAACEAANAADAAAAAAGSVVGPEEPPVVFDDPSPVDTLAPPPAPPAPMMDIGANTSLDRIEVTGSRIDRADIAGEGVVMERGLRPRDAETGSVDRALQQLARTRSRFADTALWLPQLRLAPGETREIEVNLPDNLTRWRALAWSSDAGDDFHLAEATLEAGLPLEARLQVPARLYPGDTSRLAANARQTGDEPVEVRAELRVEGLGAPLAEARPLALAPRGQAGFALEIAPTGVGRLQASAAVDAAIGRDAVAASIEVASPLVDARRVQAGWLGDAPLSLSLPRLPEHASDARLKVSLLHGTAALETRWIRDLRDYPHRCWEQILSRAVAAALAIERGGDVDWPEARAAITEALDNAVVFQSAEGDFRFFAEESGFGDRLLQSRPQVALTAYTLRALSWLRERGYAVDADVDRRAREFLESGLDGGFEHDFDEEDGSEEDWRLVLNEAAFALSAVDAPDADLYDVLREDPSRQSLLSLPARIALASVLQAQRHPSAREALDALLALAPLRGNARVLQSTADDSRWMGSRMREQCALIDLVRDAQDPGLVKTRRELIAGLGDLYAGGPRAVDTQTGATCLLALRDAPGGAGRGDVSLALQPGAPAAATLTLASTQRQADWEGDVPADGTLRMRPVAAASAPASYVAEVAYREDARFARASAVGFSLERRYQVLRERGWRAIDGQTLREGDWVRITLVVRTGAPRHFVAVTDAVPGGLRPTDLALGSLAGLDLERVSDRGSGWFATRKLDPRAPKFYAEYLPQGTHELHYFARIGNSGDYLAAPAAVELMYGDASDARTAAQRIVIESSGER